MQARSRARAFVTVIGAAIAAALLPAVAQADGADPRWQAFVGCWAPVADGTAVPDHIICFRETAGGATALTLVDDAVQAEELIVADGSSRRIEDASCTGTETARWSDDGTRLYTRASVDCGAGLLGRESSGILALSAPGMLIDVQTVGVGDEHGVRVLQYRALAPSEYPPSMRALAPAGDNAERLFASAPLSLDDVIEASRALPAPAVQAMLVNLPASRIRVDANALMQLADAGVDAETIDVVVALSYPEKFTVAAAAPALEEERAVQPGVWATAPYYDPWRDPWSRYDRYGYGYSSRYSGGYYYSPFGYNPYGWGYGGGRVIIIDRDDDAGTGSGTVVKGRGYTRGSSPSTGSASGRASTATAPTARTSRPAATGTSTTRTTGTAAPTRSSEGSSSGTTTRKAKPRGCCSN